MKQFNDVDSKRGAPMGRREFVEDPEATVTLFRVRMVDECYDDGGAYWGMGTPLYCARNPEAGVQLFVRADSWEEAKEQILDDHPFLKFNPRTIDLDDVVEGYLGAALWTGHDDDGELDGRASVDDFTDEAREKAREACQDFIERCAFHGIDLTSIPLEGSSIGYDFWLTRNGHGAGFWDRGLGKVGRQLTDICKLYGELSVWIDDTNKLHFE